MTPDLPFDPELKTLTLGDHTVSYTDDGGAGPTLLFVPGLPGSVRDFRWLGSALRQKLPEARVVRLDMPGFGETAAELGGDLSLFSRTRFIVSFMEALDLQDAVVCGHSMGGALAGGVASLCPERTRALVLLSSIGRRPHRGLRASPNPKYLAAAVATALGRWLFTGKLRDGFVKAGFPRSTSDSALYATVRSVAALNFDDACKLWDGIAEGLPAHSFSAKDDPLVEPKIVKETAESIGASLHLMEDGGHNIQKTYAVELAEAFAKIVADR